jgi:carbohydrate-selective porin OprB
MHHYDRQIGQAYALITLPQHGVVPFGDRARVNIRQRLHQRNLRRPPPLSPTRRRRIPLGDGGLRYGLEKIFETYYTAHIWRGVSVAFDYQHVSDPGYNRDRGPASVVSLRMHIEDAIPFGKLGGNSGR